MTVARVTQVAVEVLRKNTAVTARTTQVAVEVLRSNGAVTTRVTQVAVEVLRPNAADAPPPAPSASAARPVVFITS